MKNIFIFGILFCVHFLNAQSNQPFTPHMEAYVNGSSSNNLNPIDTGFVDVCLGDTVVFVATPDFSNSLENTGTGYSQDVNVNIDFEWTIDGVSFPNNDTIIFVVSLANGYLVNLNITDQNGENAELMSKVRTGMTPEFTGFYISNDSLCTGETAQIFGGASGFGDSFSFPDGGFANSSSQYVTGLTFLPDGSGAQYEAPITISGFPQGATITNAQELNQVCITMEHSYAGDLEIWLQCPNGTTVPLVNSYSPGAIPGGASGGGTHLGDPIDDNGGGGPGEGWEYCFSSVFNDIGPMTQNWGNTIPAPNFGEGSPSVDPSYIYAPESSFGDFFGCPFNGEWTIFVQDNLSIDDGYIFGWGIDFYSSTTGISNYQNTLDSAWWTPNTTIIDNLGDSSIIVAPENGNNSYTFNVMDDFGCIHDTTISVTFNAILASMNANPSDGCTPIVVTFDYSGSVGDSFYLDFGDGIYYYDTIPNVFSHFYSEDINATAILYVNNDNCSDTAYVTINTSSPITNYISDSAICGNPYNWNGDLIYDSGVYTQVNQGSNGCDSIVVLALTYVDESFDLGFIASQQLFTAPPFAVQFTNTTPNLSSYDFWWDFGDGTSIQSNNLNVFHEYTSNGSYTVSLYAADLIGSCSDTLIETDFIFTTGQSSINENVFTDYQIFPNPTTNFIVIQSEKVLNNKFNIYDQQGREVMKGKLTGKNTKLSIQKLFSGTYIVQVDGIYKPTVVLKH